MEVRPDILKKLTCSVCGKYLSCVPIRMRNDGAALCGRCCDPDGVPTLRITPYEELAQMVVFPCAFKSRGCTETLYMTETKDHEEGCMYRQYVCPVAEPGQCDWSGCRKDILDHCTQQHQDNLLQDPCTFQHEIRESNHKTFLLAAFEMLFIIHCKVCLASMNIYHSVRLIGKSRFANNYKLIISNNKIKLSNVRDVAPEGSMSLQENVSVQVNINTILHLFGDFKDILFRIKLGRKCVKCYKCEVKSAWPSNEGWCCKGCAPTRTLCKFSTKGCTYTDEIGKVTMHEEAHCKYDSSCSACSKDVAYSRDKHYVSKHPDLTYKAGEFRRAKLVSKVEECMNISLFIESSIGTLQFGYILRDSEFCLDIWCPLHTKQLYNYRCVVTLRHPIAGYTLRKTMSLRYEDSCDWCLNIKENEFLMYVNDNAFDIKFVLVEN